MPQRLATTHIQEVWLVRHPDCVKRPGEIVGQLDVPLSTAGETQHTEITNWFAARSLDFSAVYTSDLQRCRRLALSLAGNAMLHCDARLREQSFGAWQGCVWADISPSQQSRIWTDPWHEKAPTGENLQAVESRILSWWTENIADAASGGRHLVITHAGVIRALVRCALGIDPSQVMRLQPASPSLTRITSASAGCVLAEFSSQPWRQPQRDR